MASRLGKLAKMGGAVAGFFRGGADNTAPNPSKQPEEDLAEGAKKLPKTGSPKPNQKVSLTPPQFGQAPDPALKTLKADLGQYANDLTANDQQLAMVAQGLLSGPAPKGLAAARSQVDQLADDMVEDLDTLCRRKLGIDLGQALSKINFQGAHWEHDLKLGLKTSLGSTGFPPDTSERMAGWLLDQMVATGSVCMAALEEGDDRVFGEYVKLATGAVHEQLGLIQDKTFVDTLVRGPADPHPLDRRVLVKAFAEKTRQLGGQIVLEREDVVMDDRRERKVEASPNKKRSRISSMSCEESATDTKEAKKKSDSLSVYLPYLEMGPAKGWTDAEFDSYMQLLVERRQIEPQASWQRSVFLHKSIDERLVKTKELLEQNRFTLSMEESSQ